MENEMKYLVLLTPAAGKTVEDVAPYMVEEIKAVWSSYNSAVLREFYFSPSPPTVTLIYEVADEAAVHAELDRLPMIEEKLLDRQVVALGPFVQLQALFGKSLMGTA
jgi:hypothetical protein